MKQEEYLKQRDTLLDYCINSDFIQRDKIQNRTFNIVSANLLNFLPSIPHEEHENIFRQTVLHEKLGILDVDQEDPLNNVKYEGLTPGLLNLIKTQPAIICSFHMSSLRLINYFLGFNNVKYSLVIGNNIIKSEGKLFEKIFDYYKADIHIISAHAPNAGVKMLKDIRKGRSLVIYIDGNTGSGDDSIRNQNREKILFLSESLYARKGTAYLSYVANVPLITAICYKKSLDDVTIRFHDPIYPERTVSKDLFSKLALQEMYDSFAVLLKQYPGQWECWKYLHMIINPKEFKSSTENITPVTGRTDKPLLFNTSSFGLFNVENDYFLFNKRNYASYPINHEIYNVLKTSSYNPNSFNNLDNHVLKQLHKNKVLI